MSNEATRNEIVGHRDPKSAKYVPLMIVVIVLSVLSHVRNNVYNNTALWLDVIRKSPNKIRGYQNFGNELVRNGKNDEGIAIYLKALEEFPDNPEVHYNLGRCYVTKGLIDEAVIHFNEAIRNYRIALQDTRMQSFHGQIQTRMAKAYVNLGSSYYIKGNAHAALDNYAAALELNPNDALTHYNIGVIYFNSGMPEKAGPYLSKAHSIDPDKFLEKFDEQELTLK